MILVFVHGWPDDATLWERQVRFFEPTHRCVTLTLPGFGDHDQAGACDFPELVQLLFNVIQESKKPGEKVVLIGHDWGAFLCYLFEQKYPDQIESLITVDVGAHLKAESFMHATFLLGYQWWLIAAMAVGRVIPALGNAMSRKMAKFAGAPDPGRANFRMSYLYFYFWRAVLFPRRRRFSLAGYSPRVPTLYIFGGAKRFMFHSSKWIRRLEAKNGNAVLELPAAGHWVMIDEPEKVNLAIEGWLWTHR